MHVTAYSNKMADYLNDFKMEQLISACESLFNANKFDALAANLNEFSRLFRPDFFNKGSSIFKPLILKKPLISIIKYFGSNIKVVSDAAKSVILHIVPILSAINPVKFIDTLKEIQKMSIPGMNLNRFFALILPSISYALKTFDESAKMQSFSFLLSIFQNSQDFIDVSFLISSKMESNMSNGFYIDNIDDVSNDICDIPISIFSKYAPLNELEKLVTLKDLLLENTDQESKKLENLDLLGGKNPDEIQAPKQNSIDAKKEAEIELFLQKKGILSARICNFRGEMVKTIISNTQDLEVNQRIQFLQHYIRYLHKKLLFSTTMAVTLLDRIYLKLKNFSQPEFEPLIQVFTLIIEKYKKPEEKEDQKDAKNKLNNEKIMANKLTMIIENLIDTIKKNKIKFSLFNKILNVLYKSARSERSLITRDQILPFIKNASSNNNDEYRLISLKIMFLFPDKGEVMNILAPFLLTFHNFQTNVYSEYLLTLEENLPLIDDEMLTLILNESVNPLPLLPLSAYSILRFLNAIPKRVFLKKNLNLNVYNLVDKYLLINDKKVQKELSKFVAKVNLSIRLSNPNLDFFSENSSSYIVINSSSSVYSDININFLNEMLEYRLVHPNNLVYALNFIQKFTQPPDYKKYFRTILNLLVYEVKLLGFNLPKLYKELNLNFNMNNFASNSSTGTSRDRDSKEGKESKEKGDNHVEFDHLWIFNSDLVNMFTQIDSSTSFEKSLFGKLLYKTLESIKVLYQPNYESEVAILTSCTSSIFCALSLDIIENKINKSTKELNEIIKILNDSALPMSECVRISQFCVHCLSVKTSLSSFLPYLKEGAEQSREIADFLALHSTPSTLTKPIPTFLSFVDAESGKENKTILFKRVSDSSTAMSKWSNYVDLCQQILEPEQWVIIKGDKDRINKLNNYKNGYIERALERVPEDEDVNPDTAEAALRQEANNESLEFFEVDERELHFRLEKKWQKEESLYELTMFLWHSPGIKETIDKEMLKEIENETNANISNVQENQVIGGIQKKFKTDRKGLQYMSYMEIEEIALNGADKDNFLDLLIGFFNYSSVNHKQIQVKRWLDALNVTKYDKKHILMIALFFENVHCPFSKLPRQISILAQNALTSFGYPLMTKPLLILAYLQLTGIQWFLVRSIIGIDPEFFKEFPIISFDFNINQNSNEAQPPVKPSLPPPIPKQRIKKHRKKKIKKKKLIEKPKEQEQENKQEEQPSQDQNQEQDKVKDENNKDENNKEQEQNKNQEEEENKEKEKENENDSENKDKDEENKDQSTSDDKDKDKPEEEENKKNQEEEGKNKEQEQPAKQEENKTDKYEYEYSYEDEEYYSEEEEDNQSEIVNKRKIKKHEFMISSGCSMTLFDYYVSLSQTVFDPNTNMANFDLDYFYYKKSDSQDYFYNHDSGLDFINNELCISPPWSIPTNRKWPSKMKTFFHSHIKVGYSNMVELSTTVFNDIISKVKSKNDNDNEKENDNKNNTIPEIFYILMNTNLTTTQRKTVQDIFLTPSKLPKSKEDGLGSTSSLLLKSLNNDDNNNDENSLLYDISIRKYYNPSLLTTTKSDIITKQNKGKFKSVPSLTLKTFRSLLCQFAKPVEQSKIQDFVDKQSPVHPACCYETFARQGIHVWKPKIQKYASPKNCGNFELDMTTYKNSVLDNSRAGLFDISILSLLKIVSDEAVSTLLYLFSLDERDLLQLKDAEIGSLDVIKSEILKTLFDTVSNRPESNIYFAAKVMKAIKYLLQQKLILIDDLSAFICNREFLTSKNFLCAAFVFLSFEKIAVSMGRNDIASFCKVLKSEEADIFEKEENWKKKFFSDSSNPSVIIETFHHY